MEKQYSIMVVDDEYGMRDGVERVLKPYGHLIHTAENGKQAFELIAKNDLDLALIDLKLPDADGLEILDTITKKDPLTVCIIITAYATLDTAVDATKRGAFDYLAKPFTADQLLVVVDKGLDRRDLLLETESLRRERDRSLLELAQEQTKFNTVISCMNDGVIVTNREDKVVLYNGAGSFFLKGRTDVKPGTPLSQCMEIEDLRKMIMESSHPTSASNITGKEITLEGKTWLANCAVLRDEEGDFLGTVTTLSDISEQKELEKAKSRFVSLVAHELKAPVAAIKGFLDIIIKKAAGDNEAVYQNMMERSRERADGLLGLINDLLQMSRLDRVKVERHIQPVDLKQWLQVNADFFNLEIQNNGLKLIWDIPDGDISVKADPEELNRIITNLISNAVKYNREEGSVKICAGIKGQWAWFSVEDSGIGMTPEEQSRLFEDFYRANNPLTRKRTGTGLGLAITRRMVEGNFGRIEVESQSGKGSKFTVILPTA